ncbi:MAG: hypothetical protein GEU71_15765 [Actinobacteria bacterium]|nr:hypothetical protein [Actinomycetota bacterium]
MKLEIELFRDNDVGQWGYGVPAMSIVGTGCRDREAAEANALDAISFALEAQGDPSPADSIVVEYEVKLTKSPQAN